jgi:hypothetical protein
MVDPTMIIKAVSLAMAVAEFTGLVESTAGKLDRILHAPLGAGLLTLRDAGAAISRSEQAKLIDQAAARFRDAAQHEVGIRRMEAHL